MINWWETPESIRQQREHVRRAKAHWRAKHGDPVNVTHACEEYAVEVLKKDKNFLKYRANQTPTKEGLVEQVKRSPSAATCPACGARLTMEFMPRCRQVNPEGYSAGIYCENDACTAHWLTKESAFQVARRLERGEFDQIDKFKGSI